MLVGVSNKFYLIIIISRFIHISSCVMCQCWYPLILVLSCFRRQASLYQQLNCPLLAVQGREPKQRQFSGITRQDSIRKCVAQFLEVIIRLSRQILCVIRRWLSFDSRQKAVLQSIVQDKTSRWRQHCDLLRNARVILAQCSSNDVMTFMIWRQNSLSYVIT